MAPRVTLQVKQGHWLACLSPALGCESVPDDLAQGLAQGRGLRQWECSHGQPGPETQTALSKAGHAFHAPCFSMETWTGRWVDDGQAEHGQMGKTDHRS